MHGGGIEGASNSFGIKKERIIDFSSNVNPVALPDKVKNAICSGIRNISRYPDRESLKLRIALGEYLGIDISRIAAGNGSADLIYRAASVLKPKIGFVISPSFSEYERALSGVGARITFLLLRERNEFNISVEEIISGVKSGSAVFLCNPNNPTGTIISQEELKFLSRELNKKNAVLIIDEAFIDTVQEHSLIVQAAEIPNLLVLRSMTKFFGLTGLRLGYAVGNKKLIKEIHGCGQPWPVNIFAQAAGEAVLQERSFINKSRDLLLKERNFLYTRLCSISGLKPYSSYANFILVKIGVSISSSELQKGLMKRGIFIRDCSNFRGLNNKYIRIAVRKHRESLLLIGELKAILNKENKK